MDFGIWGWLMIFGLIAAGLLAVSSLIISKKPEAKELINKLVPFQGIIGVALLGIGILSLLSWFKYFSILMKIWAFGGAIIIAAVVSSIILGFLFGMPLIAKWIPGDSPAEQKAMEMQKKVAGVSVLFGLIGLAAGLGLLLIRLEILKPSF